LPPRCACGQSEGQQGQFRGKLACFVILLYLESLQLVVSIAGGSETQVSLLGVIFRQMLAVRRHHEPQLMALHVLPRGSREERGEVPWRKWSKRCWMQTGT